MSCTYYEIIIIIAINLPDYFCEETAVENVSSDFSRNDVSCLAEDYSQRFSCQKLHVRLAIAERVE